MVGVPNAAILIKSILKLMVKTMTKYKRMIFAKNKTPWWEILLHVVMTTWATITIIKVFL